MILKTGIPLDRITFCEDEIYFQDLKLYLQSIDDNKTVALGGIRIPAKDIYIAYLQHFKQLLLSRGRTLTSSNASYIGIAFSHAFPPPGWQRV